jgi:hypothetical protein
VKASYDRLLKKDDAGEVGYVLSSEVPAMR